MTTKLNSLMSNSFIAYYQVKITYGGLQMIAYATFVTLHAETTSHFLLVCKEASMFWKIVSSVIKHICKYDIIIKKEFFF